MGKTMNWLLSGNSGTVPPTDFQGTTDNQPLVIKTNNTERMRIDVAGNVGIGTTSPTQLLELIGRSEPLIRITNTGMTGSPFLQLGMNAGNNAAIFQASDGKDFKFYNGQYALNIAGNGNVGIGVAAPSRKLEIAGTGGNILWAGASTGSMANIDLSGHVQLREFSNGGIAYLQARDDSSNRNIALRIRTQKAGAAAPSIVDAATIDANGNVGIGTASPAEKLHVSGQGVVRSRINSDSNAGVALTLKERPQWSVAAVTGPPVPTVGPRPNPADFQIYNDLTGQNALYIAGASLYVGIGTASPAEKLHVSGQGVVRSRINSDSNAGMSLTLKERPQWSVATVLSQLPTAGPGVTLADFQIYNDRVGQNALYIDGVSLNVGIGTSSPEARLEVNGDVKVSGDILLTNADCAEDFDIVEADKVEPGTVMVIDQEGALRQSHQAYDKKVAGVTSGAGDYKPGIVLDKHQSQDNNRMPIALVGKVYCKVDAQYSPIEVGDLLTTSATPGHAMKAEDALRAFGAVIGKALRPLQAGQGLIPILIALQ